MALGIDTLNVVMILGNIRFSAKTLVVLYIELSNNKRTNGDGKPICKHVVFAVIDVANRYANARIL